MVNSKIRRKSYFKKGGITEKPEWSDARYYGRSGDVDNIQSAVVFLIVFAKQRA
jgi:hypothetical protein